ncbi:MAG: protein kinase [Candidatus Promineifilaceae bacterium]
MDDSFVGEQVGNYRIEALLGRGGMGAVYRAQDINLARLVALKVMHRHLADQSRFKQRFMQEAQAAARLDHPSIVNIQNFGQDGDTLYMVMTFIEGGNLADYIKALRKQGKSVKLDEILFLLSQVADALGYAHARGVLHRDVKPDNIMIKRLFRPERAGEPPLRAVVTDFGLAKLLEGGMHTATGTLMGTKDYISPEQCKGEQPGPQSDIYALGVMLYHFVTGKPPYEINSLTEALVKHINEIPPPPTVVRPGLPASLEAVINMAMAKDPADRFENAEVFATRLRQIRAGLTEEQIIHFAPMTHVLSVIDQLTTEENVIPPVPTRTPTPPPTTVESPKRVSEPANVKMVLRPTRLSVVPGNKVTADIILQNTGGTAASVRLHVESLPPEWVKIRQDTIHLPPGSQQASAIIISPPLESSTTAGIQTFRVAAINSDTHQEMVAMAGQVHVGPFERFISELRPNVVKNGETARLFVRNDGNVKATFQVGGEDPQNLIQFGSVNSQLQDVAPGQVGMMDLRVSTENRPLIGRTKTLPFKLQIRTQSSYQPLDAQLAVKPRIPIALLGVILILVCLVGAAGVFLLFNNGTRETVDVEATNEAQLIAQQQTEEARPTTMEQPTPDAQETQTAEKAVEAEETVAAISTESDEDEDNDGLSDLLELALGTDPDVSDTDGDGLLDGEEINQFNSDPTKADTDGDDLADGEEIRIYHTSANNPDTDGDGVTDGQEIESGRNPLLQETSTPTVTSTPAATPTETPTPTPTVTPTPQNTAAGTGSGLPLGFESFGVWGRGDQAYGTITQSGEQVHSGGSSAKISYDFPTTDNDFVVFLQFDDIPGEPTALSVWVYGDGSGHYLNAWIIDSEGETWQVPFGRVTHTGWAQMTGEIDTDQDWPWTHISGPSNEVVDYPIRFRGFALDDLNNAYTGQGEIYLDDLTAVQ